MNQRRAQITLAMVFAVHGAASGNFATRVPWLQERLDLSPGAIGLALLCVALGSFVAIPVAAKLVLRVGARRVTRLSLLALSAGLALPALMPNLTVLCVVLFLYGIAVGAADTGMKQQAIVVEAAGGRPIMSRLHGLWSVGTLLGAGIGTMATFSALDARIHLGVVAAALCLITLIIGAGLPATNVATVTDEPAQTITANRPRRKLAPSRALLVLGLVGFCATFAEAAAHSWSSVYIAQLDGAGPGAASLGFAVFVASMAVGRLSGDRLVQTYGSVKVVRLGGLLAVGGAVLVVLSSAPVTAMPGFAMIGLGLAAIVPVVVSAAGKATPIGGTGVSTVVTICYLAGLASPGAIGGIADTVSLAAAFAATAVVIAIVVAMAGVLRPQTEIVHGPTITRPAKIGARLISFTRAARPATVMALTLGRSNGSSSVAVTMTEPVSSSAVSFTGETVTAMMAPIGLADDSPTVEMPAMSRHPEPAIATA